MRTWLAILAVFLTAGCSGISPEALEVMTPEEYEAAKQHAAAVVQTGQVVAEAGEALPFPLSLIAYAGGAALIYAGGRKTAQLTKTAVTKVVVPAIVNTAGKILAQRNGNGDTTPEAATSPELAQNAEPKQDGGNGTQTA